MSNPLCAACETVAHCLSKGCIPLVEAEGGRFVDTHTHEAPRFRVPITFADVHGTLAEPIAEVNVIARCGQFAALLLAFGCAAAGIHAFFFR